MAEVMNNCYMFKISANEFERKENMNKPRATHGLQKMAQKIFAFGGNAGSGAMRSGEVYDIVKNSWKNLADMPAAGSGIRCVRVQNQILISSRSFR